MELLGDFSGAFWLRLGTAIACGAIVGLERQFRNKPAGIRTSILICLGTEVFVYLGTAFGEDGADPARVLGQVVTGVGFLGGGVILARGELVTGVTSAAVVWVLAAIGATIGLGHLVEAAALSVVTVAILTCVRLLEGGFKRLRGGSDEPDSQPGSPAPL